MPANFNRFFIFGATAPTGRIGRAEPARHRRAARLGGVLDESEVFVVGDTPANIDAADQAGAVSVGVATGRYTTAELSAAGGRARAQLTRGPVPGPLEAPRFPVRSPAHPG